MRLSERSLAPFDRDTDGFYLDSVPAISIPFTHTLPQIIITSSVPPLQNQRALLMILIVPSSAYSRLQWQFERL